MSHTTTPLAYTQASLPALPHVPGTDPARSALDLFRTAIAARLVAALPALSLEQAYAGVDYGKKGEDFTVALPRFRLPGGTDVLAKAVTDSFAPDAFVEGVRADKNFLHFRCATPTLARLVLDQVHHLTHATASKLPEYGSNEDGKGKRALIEYSSPNIAKDFHIGHLRSTIIGAFLANVHKACGWEVVSMNYLGDWGTQFGMIAVGFEKYGNEAELEADPIKYLYKIYVQISKDAAEDPSVKAAAAAWFARMEAGEDAALANWRRWRALSVRKYTEEYARLNVRFDVYTGESEVGREWQDKALARLDELGLIADADGAKIVDLEKFKLQKAVLRKKDGTSIYLTRDIGGAIERFEKYKFDKMIYVISSQQDLHVAQFFKVLQLMELPWADRLEHVNYGLVQGMSTRKGTAVFLEDIIREAAGVMHEQMRKNEEKYKQVEDPERVSAEVGITGVKIQDMAAKRVNNYTFNWERMLSFEGDTGPYIQYAHVRLSSIERKNPQLLPLPPPPWINTALLTEPQARDIIFHLGSYPDVVRTALRTREPSGVVTFAMRLAHAIASAWDAVLVKGEPDAEKARARMWMYVCARDVLGAALRLLTIEPLERM